MPLPGPKHGCGVGLLRTAAGSPMGSCRQSLSGVNIHSNWHSNAKRKTNSLEVLLSPTSIHWHPPTALGAKIMLTIKQHSVSTSSVTFHVWALSILKSSLSGIGSAVISPMLQMRKPQRDKVTCPRPLVEPELSPMPSGCYPVPQNPSKFLSSETDSEVQIQRVPHATSCSAPGKSSFPFQKLKKWGRWLSLFRIPWTYSWPEEGPSRQCPQSKDPANNTTEKPPMPASSDSQCLPWTLNPASSQEMDAEINTAL